MNGNIQTLSTDVALGLVADGRRRTVLKHFIESGEETVTVAELARGIVDREHSLEGGSVVVPSEIETSLHHTHLPKLASAGVVRYEPRKRTVQYRHRPPMEELVQFVAARLE